MLETIKLCLHITHRNWVVYKKSFVSNISPTVADPLFMVFSLGLGLGAAIPGIDGKTYLQFLAPGLAASTALLTSFFETSWGFYIRMTYENVFKAMLTTPIGVREVILGEFLWVGIKGAVMMIGVSLVLALFGIFPSWHLFPLIGLVGFMIAIGCGALGLIASAYVKNINQFQTVYAWLISPLYFLSGIFFPLDQMPWFARSISQLFPLSHGVRLTQAIYWGEFVPERVVFHSLSLAGGCLVLGAVAYYATARRLRP